MVSDGEQLQGDAIEAAQKALREGIRVHTAGVGSAMGARVPARAAQAPGFVRNALGREVLSRRDEQRLQRIAQAGGGLYTRIDEANSRALVDWFRRAAATFPRSTEKRLVNEPRERFQWPLALALAILAGEWMLGDRKRRHIPGSGEKPMTSGNTAIHLLPCLAGVLPCCSARSPVLADDYALARLTTRAFKPMRRGTTPRPSRHGRTFHSESCRAALQRPVWFQLGNVQFRMGEPLEQGSPEEAAELWRRSCEAYRSALLAKPRDPDIRHNLALVQRRLARLTHRLGMEAFRASEGKPLDAAIDLLRTSTEHLDEAANLAPDDVQIRSDRDRAWQALRERLKDRAQAAENQGR